MVEFTAVKDSGDRTQFSTGAVRDKRVGKGRYDLIPPTALRRVAKHYENGAVKYGDRNWEKGMPQHNFIDSAIRHLQNYLEGDRSEDHLSAAVFNVFGLIHQEEMMERGLLPVDLADLPSHVKPTYQSAGEVLKACFTNLPCGDCEYCTKPVPYVKEETAVSEYDAVLGGGYRQVSDNISHSGTKSSGKPDRLTCSCGSEDCSITKWLRQGEQHEHRSNQTVCFICDQKFDLTEGEYH